MNFSQIIGHGLQLAPLRAALAKRRLHHAYLFVGPEGVGKRSIAFALAQAVHCASGAENGCERCNSCLQIKNSNHPDVRVVGRLEGKKEITIHQVREIERELRYRSFGGGRKIAVVDPAGAMNGAAQNALLKTLEEPPENSLLILIAPNAAELLPTVRSRCLRVSFAPLSRAQVAGYLQANSGSSEAEAQGIAAMSMGSIGTALSLKDEGWMEKRRKWCAVIGDLGGGNFRAALQGAEALAPDREEVLEFLRWAESWYRDLLVHGVTREPERIVNVDLLPQLERQAQRFGSARAARILDEIPAAVAAIQRNLNRRFVLEKLLLAATDIR